MRTAVLGVLIGLIVGTPAIAQPTDITSTAWFVLTTDCLKSADGLAQADEHEPHRMPPLGAFLSDGAVLGPALTKTAAGTWINSTSDGRVEVSFSPQNACRVSGSPARMKGIVDGLKFVLGGAGCRIDTQTASAVRGLCQAHGQAVGVAAYTKGDGSVEATVSYPLEGR